MVLNLQLQEQAEINDKTEDSARWSLISTYRNKQRLMTRQRIQQGGPTGVRLVVTRLHPIVDSAMSSSLLISTFLQNELWKNAH